MKNYLIIAVLFFLAGAISMYFYLNKPIEVDFSKYSILINHKSSGGRHFYHRSVTLDARNKTYTYLITTGTCTEFTHNTTESYNMVKVPAIGKDYKVVYK